MSVENVKKFFEALGKNETLADAFNNAKSEADALQVIKNAGYDVTVDELKAGFSEMNSGELSEDDLENVAGGGMLWTAYSGGKAAVKQIIDWGW